MPKSFFYITVCSLGRDLIYWSTDFSELDSINMPNDFRQFNAREIKCSKKKRFPLLSRYAVLQGRFA